MTASQLPDVPDESIALLKELFDHQKYATVIVDCGSDGSPPEDYFKYFKMVYQNGSHAAWLKKEIFSEESFVVWATDSYLWKDVRKMKRASVSYTTFTWTAYFIAGRWGILQEQPPSQPLPLPEAAEDGLGRKRKRLTSSDSTLALSPGTSATPKSTPGCPPLPLYSSEPSNEEPTLLTDWTRYEIAGASEYVCFMRNFDWTTTAIGPMTSWPTYIRQYMLYMVSNQEPRCFYLDYDDPNCYYNAACAKILGNAHPFTMAKSGAHISGPEWPRKVKHIREVMRTGVAKGGTDEYFPIPRHGLDIEEAYFSWNLNPIYDDRGCVFGVMKEFWEVTPKVLHERRAKTIAKAEMLFEPNTDPDTITEFWKRVLDVIESNEEDFPFCLVYSAPEPSSLGKLGSASIEHTVPSPFKLEGVVGLEQDHLMVLGELDVTTYRNPLTQSFRTAWITGKHVVLESKDGSLPRSLEVTHKSRGFGGKCHSAVVCPIRRVDSPTSVGIIVLGLNPLRRYDDPFCDFIKSVIDQFVKAAAAVLVPEERWKLQEQRRLAQEQERVFTKLTDNAPAGLAIFNAAGVPIYRNRKYLELSNSYSDEGSMEHSREPIHPEDLKNVNETFALLGSTYQKDPRWFHYRVQMDLSAPPDMNAPEQWRWLVAWATSLKDESGKISWIMSVLSDNTPDRKRLGESIKDALETKRRSEDFIDMTCHEMRNPLSAIIQSADGILATIDSHENGPPAGEAAEFPALRSLRASIVEAAQTILLCAQHQKVIVNDILDLSKLESNLLQVCPDRVRPVALVEKVFHMYEAEFADANITAVPVIDTSYSHLGIEHVLLDPARLLQILINLLTNAIKFTKRTDGAKHIDVTVSASDTPPSGSHFLPRRMPRNDIQSPDELYIQFDVRDTGEGLAPEQMPSLFMRFQQASARTYSKYGGSGLGLFICRELAELQGGQIGVQSVAGQGSTFTFYIKARRWLPPSSEDLHPSDTATEAVLPGAQIAKNSVSASLAYSEASTLDSGASANRRLPNIPTSPQDLHILLVEDNLMVQKVGAKQLRNIGCTVHVANHGVECLKFLENSCYYSVNSIELADTTEVSEVVTKQVPLTVILLDQEMPVMDGLTCVRRIREMQQTGKLIGHVPVIACTGNARIEQIKHAIEQGMDDVVTKPFRIPELLAKINDLLQKMRSSHSGAALENM